MSWIKDVKEEITQLDKSEEKLKGFYRIMTLFFLALGTAGYLFDKLLLFNIAAIGLVVILIAAIIPYSGSKIYIAWMALALALGWIMSRLLLILIYYLIVTPIGLIARISGKRFLDTDYSTSQKSYWVIKEKQEIDYTKMS